MHFYYRAAAGFLPNAYIKNRIARIEPRFATLLALLVAACGARDRFGFARNTATTFDVFYWLQVTNFNVLLNSAPNGPDYIDILGLCLHAQDYFVATCTHHVKS
jgi:hypothetical protein